VGCGAQAAQLTIADSKPRLDDRVKGMYCALRMSAISYVLFARFRAHYSITYSPYRNGRILWFKAASETVADVYRHSGQLTTNG
jgi:hypothetical protein